MSKHRVVTHNWINGVLNTFEQLFETHEAAMDFVSREKSHTVKVYNEAGNLTHITNHLPPGAPTSPQTNNTYA
jgi:hypothetical protein